MSVIEFAGVSHAYGDRQVLEKFDLTLREDRIGIIGSNGSGKSTLARMINGLVLPSNQNRAVSEVPVSEGSSAGAVYQVFQRTGTALGIAVVGSVFYGRLDSTGGDFADAFRYGVALSAGFGILTALLAGVEGLRDRRAATAG